MAITFPWTRGTEAQRAANSTVPAAGMLAVTSEGNVYAVDGATTWAAATRLAKAAEVTAEATARTTADAAKVAKGELVINVRDYGAIGDGKTVTGSITAGSATLTATGFTSADVGKLITIGGAGPASGLVTVTASMTAASPTLTGTGFTPDLVGKVVLVPGAGASGATLKSTVTAYVSATALTLGSNATTTVTGASATYADYQALTTTIAAYTSATVVTLADTATTTVTAAAISYGTDDTAAIQAAITYATPRRMRVFIPRPPAGSTIAHYALSAQLVITLNAGMGIVGDAWQGTELRQYTDNTPIIAFTDDNTSSVTIEDLRLAYANPQIYSYAPNSVAIPFINLTGADSFSGIYHLSFRNLRIANATYGFAVIRTIADTTSTSPWWGSEWNRVLFSGINRSCIKLNLGSIGAPCNTFRHIKIFQNTSTAINDGHEAALQLRGEAIFEGLDVEFWRNQIINMPSGNYCTITGMHVEHHYVTNNTGGNRLMYFAAVPVTVSGINISYDDANGFPRYTFYADTTASISVRSATLVTPTNGTNRLFAAPFSPSLPAIRLSARDIISASQLWDPNSIVANITEIDGHPPLMQTADVLPTAAVGYRGRSFIVPGNGTTTADSVVTCELLATGAYSWVTQGVSGSAPFVADVQTFTTSGTWTMPAGATLVTVMLIAGGCGGGSGRRDAANTIRCGGGGGGGGGVTRLMIPASQLTSTVTVTVGAGGAGGAAVTTDTTSGNSGSLGATSSFGAYARAVTGGVGVGGTASAGTGGTGGAGTSPGGAGAAASTTGGAGTAIVTTSAIAGAPGGPAGGGITSANVAGAGATGAASPTVHFLSASGGVVDGATPTAGESQTAGVALPGGSGGSGAASITTAAQAGAAGGNYGAGGAGGGASLNGFASGAGGAGGAGIVVVISQ